MPEMEPLWQDSSISQTLLPSVPWPPEIAVVFDRLLHDSQQDAYQIKLPEGLFTPATELLCQPAVYGNGELYQTHANTQQYEPTSWIDQCTFMEAYSGYMPPHSLHSTLPQLNDITFESTSESSHQPTDAVNTFSYDFSDITYDIITANLLAPTVFERPSGPINYAEPLEPTLLEAPLDDLAQERLWNFIDKPGEPPCSLQQGRPPLTDDTQEATENHGVPDESQDSQTFSTPSLTDDAQENTENHEVPHEASQNSQGFSTPSLTNDAQENTENHEASQEASQDSQRFSTPSLTNDEQENTDNHKVSQEASQDSQRVSCVKTGPKRARKPRVRNRKRTSNLAEIPTADDWILPQIIDAVHAHCSSNECVGLDLRGISVTRFQDNIACNVCRVRKTKCSPSTPNQTKYGETCEACYIKGLPCEWARPLHSRVGLVRVIITCPKATTNRTEKKASGSRPRTKAPARKRP